MPSLRPMPTTAGIGLRLPHLEEAVATRPRIGWFEIHPENFLANPHATELLVDLARDYPVSVHTVGLSVGSATGIDRQHLARVRALVDRIDPVLVSGHLAWSTHGAEYLNDLLPLPYDEETLTLVARQVAERVAHGVALGLVEAGHLDHDAFVAFGHDDRLGHAELVHALAQHFDGLIHERFFIRRRVELRRIEADEERRAAAQV